MTHLERKHAVHQMAQAFAYPGAQQDTAIQDLFSEDAQINVVHPVNDLIGPSALLDRLYGPLRRALRGFHRRDDILMAGPFEEGDWVSTHGNFVGHFEQDLWGIKASGRLEYLRFGEFFRFEGSRIVEAYIFLDLPQLMIATGDWPIQDSPGLTRGYTGMIPGPATQDGILLHETDAGESARSYQIVTDMLSQLATPDEAWRPYWHSNMMWYGPAAFGSFVGIDDFASFQTPFENAFTTWSGGSTNNGVTRHATRFGDGNYTCSAGWPSLMCVRSKPFLGQPSKGETLLMRVCDWWRRDADLLIENWVFVDIPDVLLQMGVDLFEGHHAVLPGPRAIAGAA